VPFGPQACAIAEWQIVGFGVSPSFFVILIFWRAFEKAIDRDGRGRKTAMSGG